MTINILTRIIIFGIMLLCCYINYKKCKDNAKKILYITLSFAIITPVIIYYLDRYNIPTYLGLNINIDSQSWLAFLSNYSAGIISAIISAVVLVNVTILQIKKNNEDNNERDKENLRIQNMPILKYSMNTENAKDSRGLIAMDTNDTHKYNLNISIKNIGLNSIKNIKIDFKCSLINKCTYRILGENSLEVLEKEEEITINKSLYLKSSEKPYDIEIIIYYEDVLSNWYRQILNVNYITTDIAKNIECIGIVEYEVNKEEIIKEADIEKIVV